jgi:hypothetical protein
MRPLKCRFSAWLTIQTVRLNLKTVKTLSAFPQRVNLSEQGIARFSCQSVCFVVPKAVSRFNIPCESEEMRAMDNLRPVTILRADL